MRKPCLFLILVLFCLSPIFAADLILPNSPFSFWLPDSWRTDWEGDALQTMNQSGDIYFAFAVPEKYKSLRKSTQELDTELRYWLKDIQYDSFDIKNHKGLQYLSVGGSANTRENGDWVGFEVRVYQKGQHYFLMLVVAEASAIVRHYDTITKVMDSVEHRKVYKKWEYHRTNFSFLLPKKWKTELEEEFFTAYPKSEDMSITFFSSRKIKNIKKAMDYLDDELQWWYTDINYDSPEYYTRNGLSSMWVTGTAYEITDMLTKGKKVAFGIAVYEKKGKFLLVVGGTERNKFRRFQKDISIIANSIR